MCKSDCNLLESIPPLEIFWNSTFSFCLLKEKDRVGWGARTMYAAFFMNHCEFVLMGIQLIYFVYCDLQTEIYHSFIRSFIQIICSLIFPFRSSVCTRWCSLPPSLAGRWTRGWQESWDGEYTNDHRAWWSCSSSSKQSARVQTTSQNGNYCLLRNWQIKWIAETLFVDLSKYFACLTIDLQQS